MTGLDDQVTRRVPVARLALAAPEGHRIYHLIPRSDDEVFELAHTCEPLERARARLGPRARCECGRGFGDEARLLEHHADPLRDERDRVDLR